MLSRGLQCFLDGWNAFDRVGIPWYRVGMLSSGLEYFLQRWNTFVQSWNVSIELEYLCAGLKCFI
jgi:hypothetical protein